MTAVLFLDTETLGLDAIHDPIWEFAAIRREPDGSETTHHWFVEHDSTPAPDLPQSFVDDYRSRWPTDPDRILSRGDLSLLIDQLCHDRPHIVGAVPSFDTERLMVIRRALGIAGLEPWHYHLICVETLAVGYLRGWWAMKDAIISPPYAPNLEPERRMLDAEFAKAVSLPWDSKALSRAIGVDPDQFAEHTALGDVLWARALFDAVMG